APVDPGIGPDPTTNPATMAGGSSRTRSAPAEPSTASSGSGSNNSKEHFTWLQHELNRQLTAYRRRRKRDKRKAFVLQMATVILSATITVLLGIRATGFVQQYLTDIAIALGAIITVLAAAEAFFGHRGLWILRSHTVRRLEAL